jgi:hypothetical protein
VIILRVADSVNVDHRCFTNSCGEVDRCVGEEWRHWVGFGSGDFSGGGDCRESEDAEWQMSRVDVMHGPLCQFHGQGRPDFWTQASSSKGDSEPRTTVIRPIS